MNRRPVRWDLYQGWRCVGSYRLRSTAIRVARQRGIILGVFENPTGNFLVCRTL